MQRSRFIEILNVPHSENKLSWQLGVGGWEELRLRLRFACGLAGRPFWAPCGIISCGRRHASI